MCWGGRSRGEGVLGVCGKGSGENGERKLVFDCSLSIRTSNCTPPSLPHPTPSGLASFPSSRATTQHQMNLNLLISGEGHEVKT